MWDLNFYAGEYEYFPPDCEECSFVEKYQTSRLKRCLHPQGSLKLGGARQYEVLISAPKYMASHSRRQED